MNQFIFCHNCGAKLSAGSKFCSVCGTSQSSLSASPPQQPQAPALVTAKTPKVITSFRPRIMGLGDDDDDGIKQDDIQSIDDLGISWSKEAFGLEEPPEIQRQKQPTLGDVWQEGSMAPPGMQAEKIPVRAPADIQQVIQDFKREAGGLPTETLHGLIAPQATIHTNSSKS